jgi:hypothetical protein
LANITLITVTTASATPITATTYGATVQVQEDPSIGTAWPTGDFLIYHVQANGTKTTSSRYMPSGSNYTFQKTLNSPQPYAPREIVGFIQAVTANTQFVVDESGS